MAGSLSQPFCFVLDNPHLLNDAKKQFAIKVLGYDLTQIPKDKAIIIVANHPFGGIEGVILTHVISQYRPDLKVLANRGLSIFKELSPYFIFTNPDMNVAFIFRYYPSCPPVCN